MGDENGCERDKQRQRSKSNSDLKMLESVIHKPRRACLPVSGDSDDAVQEIKGRSRAFGLELEAVSE